MTKTPTPREEVARVRRDLENAHKKLVKQMVNQFKKLGIVENPDDPMNPITMRKQRLEYHYHSYLAKIFIKHAKEEHE